ncbi:hypothetical protein EV644_12427 [Kribbella orskensis]|uniref:Uncharacterized protein n=2 Tax=Kribbellaceae TaxID=2726069 RepID=A0ABY2B9N8_9ACTN|nr:hypothetical protein EV642_12671 [Kribbella sp. VKM Ac-2500]TCO12903.1 hypothetical protein EV644_12427 [Kribbella orskensis]
MGDPTPWEVVQSMAAYEQHFNSITSQYRRLASTWMLALFTGSGFAYARTTRAYRSMQGIIVGVRGLAAASGIGALWIIDMGVYQHLLKCAFDVAREVEKAHAGLPQLRQQMMSNTKGRGMRPRLALSSGSSRSASACSSQSPAL